MWLESSCRTDDTILRNHLIVLNNLAVTVIILTNVSWVMINGVNA